MKNLAILILAIMGFGTGVITAVFGLSIIMETTQVISNGIKLTGFRLACLISICGSITSIVCLFQVFHRSSHKILDN